MQQLVKCAHLTASSAYHAFGFFLFVHVLSVEALIAEFLFVVAEFVSVLQTAFNLTCESSNIVVHTHKFADDVFFLTLERHIKLRCSCI